VGQEIRDRFTGAVEAFARRNPGSGRHGEHSRHKSHADSFGTSNEAVADTEKPRILSRGGSSSKMPAGPSSRPTSSGDCSGDQNRRWVSGSSGGSGRPSTTQRLHPSGGAENSRSSPRSPVSRNAAPGRGGSGSRDNTTFRSLERLSISTSRRK